MNTGEERRTYAVALTFSEEVEKRLTTLGEDYLQYKKYTIIPHLTLLYPFAPVFSLFRVKEQLERVAKRTVEFNIILNGIEYFEGEHNVAYAAIENKRAVKKLHADIIESLDGLIKEWYTDGKYNLENFIPHVTIINNIPSRILPDVKKRFSRRKLRYENKIAGFSLFAELSGDWQISRVFNFSGDKLGRMSLSNEKGISPAERGSAWFH